MMIYLTAIGQPPGGSSSVHICTQTIQRTSQNKQYIEQHKKYIEQHNNYEECGPCPVFAGFTLAFALQLREKHGKTSVRVAKHKHIFRLYCSACFGIPFVSILCTCCSHFSCYCFISFAMFCAPVFFPNALILFFNSHCIVSIFFPRKLYLL